ncbi:MAG: hypothetical protein NQU42_01505 [Methanothrix sp.]|uniref:hypothetical protein n=1 Tax=Methanothrix sp. TaxID=90426 RepID=UPI0025F13658|nr:hypothetical protein [Methanothrix sp.]MCQ8902763.1 hypothetical protein [Methanothrix sp.]
MEAKDTLEEVSPEDLGLALRRLRRMLQAAHRSSIDVKNSYDFYVLAFKELSKNNYADAFLYYDRAKYELTSAINEAKHNIRGLRIHSSRTVSFFFKLYGLYAVLYGVLSAVLFGALIYGYSDIRILGVPLWSSFFAGLGSSAQILTGVVDDLQREGMVVRYKRIWYTTIPLLSMIFGYMAYLLFSSGLIAFNVKSDDTVFSTMLVCFLTGFMTNWLINRLSNLSENM